MDLVHIIDTLIGIVVMGGAWYLGGMTKEIPSTAHDDYTDQGIYDVY